MASSKEYLEFILEQLSNADGVTHRAMMGEYILYFRGRMIGGIFDDRFLVKPVPAAVRLMPDAAREIPYRGAKEMLLVGEVDDRDFLARLLDAMYEELTPVQTKPRTPRGKFQKGKAARETACGEDTEILRRLKALAEPAYADFQAKLTPGVDRDRFLGVRVPLIRKLAKELVRSGGYGDFLRALPHRYYDENMLHGLILSEIQDFDRCIAALERFLPYVDNWAVCDTLSPKCFVKHKRDLLPRIEKWIGSSEEFTVRFGLGMLMKHYLDEDFDPRFLSSAASVRSDKYYVNMMIAWFFATALAKQWDSAVVYLENNALPPWVHNKTIQKARESYRITPEQKAYLATLKRKA